jgi:ABC-type dipeptide/oligopeptide/nickel transport system permease component
MTGFARFLVQRCLLALLSIWAIATITFFMAFLAPGDPAILRYGEKSSPQVIAVFKHMHGLDQPPLIRYKNYVFGVAHGDFGRSFQNDEPVADFFARAFPKTAIVATLAIILAIAVGVLIGTFASLTANSWIDRSIMGLSMAGIGIPTFVMAPFLIYVFALTLPKMLPNWNVEWPPVVWAANDPLSLLLPVLVLAARPAALVARMTRSSLLEVRKQDYIRTARAKGLSPARILFVHSFKNACLPVLTSAGTAFGFLLSGSFVVETIFAIPGIGEASVSSFTTRDYPLIQGTTFILAMVFVVVNLAVDLLYALIDPRTRAASAGAAA